MKEAQPKISRVPWKHVSRPTLVENLQVGLTSLAGIENPRLYSQTYFGTKRLLEEYVDEGIDFYNPVVTVVDRSLSYLNEATSFCGEEKRLFFRHLGRNYGRTVLAILIFRDSHLLGIVSFGGGMFGLLPFCTKTFHSCLTVRGL